MNTQTPTQARQSTLRRFVGAKRDLQFVEHGSVCFLDPGLSGTARFSKLLGSEFSVLVSDTHFQTTEYTNQGSKHIHVDSSVKVPDGCLLRIGNEFVVVLNSEITYDNKTPRRTLYLETITRNPYQAQTQVTLIAFPASVLGEHGIGTTTMQIQTTEIVVPGDLIAEFRVGELQDQSDDSTSSDSGIPVLGAYNRCIGVEEQGSYADASGDSVLLYRVTLERPTSTAFTGSSRLMLKAVPAYQSKQLRAQSNVEGASLSGLYYVDSFGGIVFGTTDDSTETLGITTHDLYGNVLTTNTLSKNDVIQIGQVKTASLLLWNHDTNKSNSGYMRRKNNDVVVTLGLDRAFNCGVEFPSMITLGMRVFFTSSNSFRLRVRTRNNTTVYESLNNTIAVDINDTTDVLVFEFYGTEHQSISVSINDNTKSVGYISYSMHANIGPDESYETTGLLLKTVFQNPQELHGKLGSFHLNDGTIL